MEITKHTIKDYAIINLYLFIIGFAIGRRFDKLIIEQFNEFIVILENILK
jgi:hypothetical protein